MTSFAAAQPGRIRRVAMVSVHTSPLEQPGQGDAGGLNVYVDQVARRLARRGIEVEVFTRATASDQPPLVTVEPGYAVRHVLAGPFGGVAKEELPALLCPFAAQVLRAAAPWAAAGSRASAVGDRGVGPGASYLSPARFDVIHSHYWLSGLVGQLARDRWGIPLVHTAHTLARVKNAALAGDDDSREPRSRELGEESVAADADVLVAPTFAEARQLQSLYAADADRIAVVPPGVDIDAFCPDWLDLTGPAGSADRRLARSVLAPESGASTQRRAVRSRRLCGQADELDITDNLLALGGGRLALGDGRLALGDGRLALGDNPPAGPRVDLLSGPRNAARATLRGQWGFAGYDAVLAFVGRIQPHKGPEVVVRALAELRRRHPDRRIGALIVGNASGSGHHEPERLAGLAASLGVAHSVRLVPALPPRELADVYRAVDVVAVPSYSESFGLVALEAQACGTPVVASSVGGLPVAVVDGVTGLLVDGHGTAAWAEALGSIALNPLRRARMALAARAHAESFAWDVTVDQLLHVYERAAAPSLIGLEAGA